MGLFPRAISPVTKGSLLMALTRSSITTASLAKPIILSTITKETIDCVLPKFVKKSILRINILSNNVGIVPKNRFILSMILCALTEPNPASMPIGIAIKNLKTTIKPANEMVSLVPYTIKAHILLPNSSVPIHISL